MNYKLSFVYFTLHLLNLQSSYCETHSPFCNQSSKSKSKNKPPKTRTKSTTNSLYDGDTFAATDYDTSFTIMPDVHLILETTVTSNVSNKMKPTNVFGYAESEYITIDSFYYDDSPTTLIQDRTKYDFTTQYANNREMYRENRLLRFMNRGEARMIEKELYDRFGYTIDQIAELSGHSVAVAIERHYKPVNYSDVLVFCGSGNNGLYGMVTARHLKLMGYDPTIFLVNEYSKNRTEGYKLFTNLKKQLQGFNIPVLHNLPSNISLVKQVHKLFVDAIFGINYDRVKYYDLPKANKYKYSVNALREINKDRSCPIVSIDVPSGWDTNIGNYEGHHINPDMLVSLIAPKVGMVEFFGRYHYIAGNFLPSILNEKYQLYVPPFNGSDPIQPVDTVREFIEDSNQMFTV